MTATNRRRTRQKMAALAMLQHLERLPVGDPLREYIPEFGERAGYPGYPWDDGEPAFRVAVEPPSDEEQAGTAHIVAVATLLYKIDAVAYGDDERERLLLQLLDLVRADARVGVARLPERVIRNRETRENFLTREELCGCDTGTPELRVLYLDLM